MGVSAAMLVVTAAATTYQAKKQEELQDKQIEHAETQAELERKRAAIKSARERAMAMRQARAARASQLAQAQQGEGTGGSGLAGAQAGIASQLGQGLSFMNANQNISNQISTLNIEAAREQGKINKQIGRAGAVASIADSAYSVFGK